MFETINRMRDAAETNMREFPERGITYYETLCGHYHAAWPSCMALLRANPDDIRAQGWVVAVHNDYRLDGVPHTFWLFTRGDKCVKGEGKCDGDALDEVRQQIARMNDVGLEPPALMYHPGYDAMQPATAVLRDLASQDGCDGPPYDQMVDAADVIDKQAELIVTLRCNLACATCLWCHTKGEDGKMEPCPYKDKCCYSTKKGFGEGMYNFWSGVDSELP